MRKLRLFIAFICVLALSVELLTATSYATGDVATLGQRSVVAAGKDHSAIIDSNHTLWVWGSNQYGQIGNDGAYNGVYTQHRYTTHADGTFTDQPREYKIQTTPVKVLENVASVSCGAYFTAAIKEDGTLWMWGQNDMGQLGNGTRHNQYVPVQVLDQVAAVSCGYCHTSAIRYDGSLWVWGHNGYNQLGTNGVVNGQAPGWGNTQLPIQTIPVKIMDQVSMVSCGNWHTAAIKTDGTLWEWGQNLSDSSSSTQAASDQVVPVQISSGVKSVCCGEETTVLTDANGVLSVQGSYKHIPFLQRTDTTAIRYGSEWHCAAICADGSLWVRGHNYSVFDTKFHKMMDDVCDVACGGTHILAVKSDGSVWAWGFNGYGQIGNGGLGEKAKDSTWAGYSSQPLQEKPYKLDITAAAPGASTIPAEPTVGGFSDVKQSSYYADAVQWAVQNNITSGTSQTTFSPDATCTKAQILTFLWRAEGQPSHSAGKEPFQDIKTSDYYYHAAVWAYEEGLISGGSFSPNEPCTRGMTMLYLWGLEGSPDSPSRSFSDVPTDSDYAQAVAWAISRGVTSGTGNNQFSPNSICTRGQIVTFLYRYMVETMPAGYFER